ncbi:WbuC family cupin fold metalloprotein [Marinilabilia rubra]|uniref:Cupin fold metalloprotein, WbuC family n=1 Tax=Marinilabilia rubra TaxID=2162893 RepID=A0A2U2BE25_9BACT|nr:WbuC family cupin fold metalloprotein [Marinilabilia rubra]PWE01326.1 cupin fold metalloprotein, WbuC family [Marinilabilia rubra]
MKLINQDLLNDLSSEASKATRKRKNYNFHFGPADVLQRMLNAFEPGTYVRPHKHENPAKREVFLLLRGRLLMLFFNDGGEVTERITLSAKDGSYGVEVPPGEWHMGISLEKGTVIYELKDGPYDPVNDKEFAPWAPPEGAPEVKEYLENLLWENVPNY